MGNTVDNNLVSRQAVLDIINFEDKWLLDAKGHNANTGIAFGGMRSKVSALPPVTPQPKTWHWIPVSERPPEEYGEYMITWTTSLATLNNKGLIGIAEYELTGEFDHENNRFKGEWLIDDYIKNYPDVKVTAWRPLPEPYTAEGSDKE
jgi:hypothetical protein